MASLASGRRTPSVTSTCLCGTLRIDDHQPSGLRYGELKPRARQAARCSRHADCPFFGRFLRLNHHYLSRDLLERYDQVIVRRVLVRAVDGRRWHNSLIAQQQRAAGAHEFDPAQRLQRLLRHEVIDCAFLAQRRSHTFTQRTWLVTAPPRCDMPCTSDFFTSAPIPNPTSATMSLANNVPCPPTPARRKLVGDHSFSLV